MIGRYDYDVTTNRPRPSTCSESGCCVESPRPLRPLDDRQPSTTTIRHVADQLTQAINAKLRRADGVYIDGLGANGSPSRHASQHASSYALSFDVAPAADYPALGQHLARWACSRAP